MRLPSSSLLASLCFHVAVVCTLLGLAPSFATARSMSADELSIAASMSAMPSVSAVVSPAHSAWIESMIVPPAAAITPGRLNPFNFTRPEGQRIFYLYVPSTYDSSQAYPLFFYFHGYQGDWQQGAQLNMTIDAERHGYFLILGQGTFASTGQRGWNGGVCCLFNTSSIVDDVMFARTALKLVQSQANIDTRRVYTSGWSNGGSPAHQHNHSVA
jgi:poly(3-hydroxybutyrate) depolymerase